MGTPAMAAKNEKRTTRGAFFIEFTVGAESRNRTGTLFPARDFESRASTYSAISATVPALSPIWRIRATLPGSDHVVISRFKGVSFLT
jgi:hypothetical protein